MTDNVITIKINTIWKRLIQISEVIGIVIIPFLTVHTTIYFVATKQNYNCSKYLKGIIGFPGLILLTGFLLSNPLLAISASLCSIDSVKTQLSCFGLLLILPLPVFGFSIYVIYNYIQSEYVTYEAIKYASVVDKVKFNLYGRWTNTFITDRYSIFFEHIKGFSENKNKVINTLRIYHVPIKIGKNIIMPYITVIIKAELYNTLFIALISLIYVLLLLIVQPLNGFRQQICESLGELITFLSFFVTFILLLKRDSETSVKNATLVSKNANIAVLIFSQTWSILFILIHLIYAHIKIYHKRLQNSKQDTANNVKTELIENSNDFDVEIFS